MSACLSLETDLKVACLGPEMSYSHSALLKFFGTSTLVSFSSNINDVFKQYNPIIVYHEYDEDNNCYKKEIHVNFDNIYMGKPIIHENNGSSKIMVPHEAKLRNFTYSSPLFVDIKITFLDKKGERLNAKL